MNTTGWPYQNRKIILNVQLKTTEKNPNFDQSELLYVFDLIKKICKESIQIDQEILNKTLNIKNEDKEFNIELLMINENAGFVLLSIISMFSTLVFRRYNNFKVNLKACFFDEKNNYISSTEFNDSAEIQFSEQLVEEINIVKYNHIYTLKKELVFKTKMNWDNFESEKPSFIGQNYNKLVVSIILSILLLTIFLPNIQHAFGFKTSYEQISEEIINYYENIPIIKGKYTKDEIDILIRNDVDMFFENGFQKRIIENTIKENKDVEKIYSSKETKKFIKYMYKYETNKEFEKNIFNRFEKVSNFKIFVIFSSIFFAIFYIFKFFKQICIKNKSELIWRKSLYFYVFHLCFLAYISLLCLQLVFAFPMETLSFYAILLLVFFNVRDVFSSFSLNEIKYNSLKDRLKGTFFSFDSILVYSTLLFLLFSPQWNMLGLEKSYWQYLRNMHTEVINSIISR